MEIEIQTKKRLQFERRQHNQKELLRLRNHLSSCNKKTHQNVTEILKETIPQILDGNKRRLFPDLDKESSNKDEKELESLRLIIAYYKNDGKFNNGYYSENDIEKLDKIIEHLKEECVDTECDLQETDILKDGDIFQNINDRIKIQNRLIKCHNIIVAYCTGVLKNTPFRLHKHPSKKSIEVSYKCNYKRDIF